MTDWLPDPKCPKCGTVEGDWQDMEWRGDGDEQTFACGSCETELTAIMRVDYSFKTTLAPAEPPEQQ